MIEYNKYKLQEHIDIMSSSYLYSNLCILKVSKLMEFPIMSLIQQV
jgi:hypothetical protein